MPIFVNGQEKKVFVNGQQMAGYVNGVKMFGAKPQKKWGLVSAKANKQHIQTGIIPPSGTKIRIKLDYTYLLDTGFCYHGIYNPSIGEVFYVGGYYLTLRFLTTPITRQDITGAISYGARHNYELYYDPNIGISRLIIDNAVAREVSFEGDYKANAGQDFWLCAANEVSQANNIYCSCHLYSAKILFDDILVFNGIPVPQGNMDYSGSPTPSNCLWDTVSQQYFQNAGNGEFGIVEDIT